MRLRLDLEKRLCLRLEQRLRLRLEERLGLRLRLEEKTRRDRGRRLGRVFRRISLRDGSLGLGFRRSNERSGGFGFSFGPGDVAVTWLRLRLGELRLEKSAGVRDESRPRSRRGRRHRVRGRRRRFRRSVRARGVSRLGLPERRDVLLRVFGFPEMKRVSRRRLRTLHLPGPARVFLAARRLELELELAHAAFGGLDHLFRAPRRRVRRVPLRGSDSRVEAPSRIRTFPGRGPATDRRVSDRLVSCPAGLGGFGFTPRLRLRFRFRVRFRFRFRVLVEVLAERRLPLRGHLRGQRRDGPAGHAARAIARLLGARHGRVGIGARRVVI